MVKHRPKPNWPRLRRTLWQRCNGRCEVTGIPLDFDTFDAHHRRLKGMGGTSRPDTDLLSNLLALDPIVHNGGPTSVHGSPIRSLGNGWLLHQAATPRLEPVLLYNGLRVWLTDDGAYEPTSTAPLSTIR
jgi:hypothetical protein